MASTTRVVVTNQPPTEEPLNDDGSLHTNIIIIGGCILSAVAVGALLYVAVLVYHRIRRNKRVPPPQLQRNGIGDDRVSEEGQLTELMAMPSRPGTVGSVNERVRHRDATFGHNCTLPLERGRRPSLSHGDVGELQILLDSPHARCDPSVTASGLTNVTRYPLEGSSCAEHQDLIVSRPGAATSKWTHSSGPENSEVDQIVNQIRSLLNMALSSDPIVRERLTHITQMISKVQQQVPPQSSRGADATAAPFCDGHYREVPAVHDDSSVTRPKHAATVERTALGHACAEDYVCAHSGRQPYDLEPTGLAAVSGSAAATNAAPEAAASAVATRSGEAVVTAATSELAELHAPAASQLTNGVVVTVSGAVVRSPAPEVQDAHSVRNNASTAPFGCQSPATATSVAGAAVTTTAPLVGRENLGGAAALSARRSEGAANGAGWSPGTAASVASGHDAATAAIMANRIADTQQLCGSQRRGVSCSAAPQGYCLEHHISYLKSSVCPIDSSSSSGCRERGPLSLRHSDLLSCRVSSNGQL